MSFEADFLLLTGHSPFPWQRALYEQFIANRFPKVADLPTGLGKTAVIVIWLLALAKNPTLPRRLVYVVNRRTVVDQATTEAERLASQLREAHARHLRAALLPLVATSVPNSETPLAISTLRGERADNAEWRRDPSRPSIIVGTVDMIGSRLLFAGYGCGFKTKPLHAGFLGQDVLLVHDESHLEAAFQTLLDSIRGAQQSDPRPLKVFALSATSREKADFTLSADDEQHSAVRARLSARKGLRVIELDDKKALPERAAKAAVSLEGRIVVFLSSLEHVEKVVAALRKAKKKVVVLTGTLRGAERDNLVKSPIFARFLPEPPADITPTQGDVYLVATSAGEVGIDISGDHLVTDLPPFDALVQRLGRVNRYGEGDALVDVLCEPLKEPLCTSDRADDDENPVKRRDYFDWARYATRALLNALPERGDGRRDASPMALRILPIDARAAASTPIPDIHAVDGLLFDRWSYTTIAGKLPGRPPVAEWLHGVAEWEPPRTTIAWRREVAWFEDACLAPDTLNDFLADYPLRARETLSDRTDRVVKHLERIVTRDKQGTLRAWLVRDGVASTHRLSQLVSDYDSKKNPLLDDATVILPPEAGGLSAGLLDGDAEFNPQKGPLYDLGPKEGERAVHELADILLPPDGMRLVRTIPRENADGDDVWWQLFARSHAADDDGSYTSRKPQLLTDHLKRTGYWAALLSERLGLSALERTAVACAGLWHDLGKKRRVWQRCIKRYEDPPLAKGPMQPSELGHYRHELGSLHDVRNSAGYDDLTEDMRDLALHLVAAHHGRARPHFPPHEAYDPEATEIDIAALISEVPLRFERLQRKYGRWGLAWLESILRAADYLASDDEDVSS
jgi:CRISPR-associated endonuclease/helicase Cas3